MNSSVTMLFTNFLWSGAEKADGTSNLTFPKSAASVDASGYQLHDIPIILNYDVIFRLNP